MVQVQLVFFLPGAARSGLILDRKSFKIPELLRALPEHTLTA